MGLLHTARGGSASPRALARQLFPGCFPPGGFSSGLFGACHCCVDVFVSCVFMILMDGSKGVETV
jgi:hypothetical protein